MSPDFSLGLRNPNGREKTNENSSQINLKWPNEQKKLELLESTEPDMELR